LSQEHREKKLKIILALRKNLNTFITVLGGTAGRRNIRCGGLHFLWREVLIDEN
jgi:hypothetical protein